MVGVDYSITSVYHLILFQKKETMLKETEAKTTKAMVAGANVVSSKYEIEGNGTIHTVFLCADEV
eukprot:2164589-Amphidinium_carterae.1